MEIEKSGGITVYTYSDYGEYLEKVIKNSTEKGASHQEDDGSFSRTKNFGEAVELAYHGWPEGLKNARKYSDKLIEKIRGEIIRDVITYDYEGMDFDISRVIEGEPEAWMKFDEIKTMGINGRKIVKIVVNCGGTADVSTNILISKGGVACALIELLELSGHRCHVVMAYGNSSVYENHVTIKRPDQFLDLDRLVFCLSHPSSFRRLEFGHREGLPRELQLKTDVIYSSGGVGSYGRSTDIMEDRRGDIYFPRGYSDDRWDASERAEAVIMKYLKAQGVTLKEYATK